MGAQRQADVDQIEIFTDAVFRRVSGQMHYVSLRAFEERTNKVVQIRAAQMIGHDLRMLNKQASEVAYIAANFPVPAVFCPPIATFNDRNKAAEANLVEGRCRWNVTPIHSGRSNGSPPFWDSRRSSSAAAGSGRTQRQAKSIRSSISTTAWLFRRQADA